MTNKRTVIGIDIGGTKVSAGLFHINGDILHQQMQLIGQQQGLGVIEIIAAMVKKLIAYANNHGYTPAAIGACVPGIYNPEDRTVWAPNIPGWNHIPLWDELTRHLNDPSIKIVIESDRSCYILGEIWQGCAEGCSDAIFIAVGTGIGAGILSNGAIINGKSGIAGAISWMALEPPYNRKYDSWGNLEHYASGNGISRSAIEILQKKRSTTSMLDELPMELITSHDVFKAYEQKDAVAVKVLDKAIKYWGMTVANLVSIFNPQKIIFGGGVFGPASQFLDSIRSEAKKWAQPLSFQEMQLEVSTLAGNAGLIGAAFLAIKSINERDHA